MALQMFMKMDGVTGESSSFQHKGWFEVLSWNWGMTSNRRSAKEVDDERTSLNEMSVVKPVGIDSAEIRLLFAQGKRIPNVEFSVTPVVGKREAEAKYVFIRMEDVVIKSIVIGGGKEENFFKEHITLLFDRIRFEYSKGTPAANNSPGVATVDYDFGWSVPSNEEWRQVKVA